MPSSPVPRTVVCRCAPLRSHAFPLCQKARTANPILALRMTTFTRPSVNSRRTDIFYIGLRVCSRHPRHSSLVLFPPLSPLSLIVDVGLLSIAFLVFNFQPSTVYGPPDYLLCLFMLLGRDHRRPETKFTNHDHDHDHD